MTHQARDFIGVFLKYQVCSGIIRLQTKAVSKTGQKNNRVAKISFPKFRDEFQTVHRRHFVIGDYEIAWPLFNGVEGIVARTRGKDLISQFFEDGSASKHSVAVIINQ